MPATCKGDVISSPKNGDSFVQVKARSKRGKGKGRNNAENALHTLVDQSEVVSCNKCTKILNDSGSIQCDRCNAWFHSGCTRLYPELDARARRKSNSFICEQQLIHAKKK